MSLSNHFQNPDDTDIRKKKANFMRHDHSEHFLSIDPFFKDEQFPSKVMALEVSLDLAKLFASTLEANGLAGHAEVLRDWIERIAERPEPKVEPSITTHTNTEEVEIEEDEE